VLAARNAIPFHALPMRVNAEYSPSAFTCDGERVQIPRSHTKLSGRRYYKPSLGRFQGRDPIGEDGGANLYAFARNNPANLWDFLGLSVPATINTTIGSPNGSKTTQTMYWRDGEYGYGYYSTPGQAGSYLNPDTGQPVWYDDGDFFGVSSDFDLRLSGSLSRDEATRDRICNDLLTQLSQANEHASQAMRKSASFSNYSDSVVTALSDRRLPTMNDALVSSMRDLVGLGLASTPLLGAFSTAWDFVNAAGMNIVDVYNVSSIANPTERAYALTNTLASAGVDMTSVSVTVAETSFGSTRLSAVSGFRFNLAVAAVSAVIGLVANVAPIVDDDMQRSAVIRDLNERSAGFQRDAELASSSANLIRQQVQAFCK